MHTTLSWPSRNATCCATQSTSWATSLIAVVTLTDPAKVEAITKVSKTDLMFPDGQTPCPKKIKSFLGLVMWYQRFIPNCSTVAKPLFGLTSETKKYKTNKGRGCKRLGTYKKLTAADWTPECNQALQNLKHAL